MGLSRDQKRKAKLKKRAERSHKHELLAYAGSKYRTGRLAPILFRTEVGIHEAYVVSDRSLTDDAVEAALVRLATRMREGPLPPLSETGESGDLDDLVGFSIRQNWRTLQQTGELPGRDDLIGILRTILHSIEVWRSKSMHSQGYLHFLEGFMKKLGVSVRKVTEDLEPIDDPEDPLLVIGRDWVTTQDPGAEAEFADRVERLLHAGEVERVIEVCQQLLGETRDLSVVPRLEKFAIRGHRASSREPGPAPLDAKTPSLPPPPEAS